MTYYKVTFDRIGRHHEVPPFLVETEHEDGAPVTADDMAELIHTYAGSYLASREFDVYVNLDDLAGWISGGQFGRFTIERIEAS